MVSPIAALIIGFIAGIVVDLAVLFFDRLKVDDPVGAIAVHGINGLFGTVAVGFFALDGGLFYGGGSALLVTQIIGVVSIAVFSFCLTYLIMRILKMTIGIRVSIHEEKVGIDAISFGIKSYTSNE